MIQDIRNASVTFPSSLEHGSLPLSFSLCALVHSFFSSLHRLSRCTVAQQLANFARPVQTRRPADLSQTNLLFIHSVFLFPLLPPPPRSLRRSAPFDQRSRFFLFFDRRSVRSIVARVYVFPPTITRNQPVYPSYLFSRRVCKHALIFV